MREDRGDLWLCVDTRGLDVETEDALIAELLAVAERYTTAHVQLPLRVRGIPSDS